MKRPDLVRRCGSAERPTTSAASPPDPLLAPEFLAAIAGGPLPDAVYPEAIRQLRMAAARGDRRAISAARHEIGRRIARGQAVVADLDDFDWPARVLNVVARVSLASRALLLRRSRLPTRPPAKRREEVVRRNDALAATASTERGASAEGCVLDRAERAR